MDSEKIIIITGANSGLGFSCAMNIAKTSPEYKIVLACRDLGKAKQAKVRIAQETGNENTIPMALDLSSLKSVRGFVESVVSSHLTPVYGLVCNAGLGGLNEGLTSEGFELLFGVNHLGHFLLTDLLLPYMSEPGRIAVVSSDMHNPPGGLTWPGVKELVHPSENLGHNRYSLSKLCNLYFTYELSRRLEQSGRNITVNAFNPGLMTDTNLFPDKRVFTDSLLQSVSDRVGSLKHSANELAALITDPRYEQVTGKYIDRGKEVPSSELSYSPEIAKELWDTSVELVNSKL